MDIGAYASALAEDRRVNHHDDLTTSLVEAEVDGERLSSAEIASFFILLVVAGNETTRNAISHGVLALSRYPEQRDKWWSDFDGLAPTAVEEIVRWASPVVYMRRTLTRDFELSGTKMAAGDKVALWYNSANRDESKFANPWAFDVARNPNPHLGFGGGGAHFCLGANLARREIRVVFDELRREIPDIVATDGTRAAAVAIHPRHQEPAGRLDSPALAAFERGIIPLASRRKIALLPRRFVRVCVMLAITIRVYPNHRDHSRVSRSRGAGGPPETRARPLPRRGPPGLGRRAVDLPAPALRADPADGRPRRRRGGARLLQLHAHRISRPGPRDHRAAAQRRRGDRRVLVDGHPSGLTSARSRPPAAGSGSA